MSEEERWKRYYKATKQKRSNPYLVDLLTQLDAQTSTEPRLAIDLGCGNGHDAHTMLSYGWRVLAVDKQPEAVAHTQENAPAAFRHYLETRHESFEEMRLPICYLVYARVSLPFCTPDSFDQMWSDIVTALQPGGYFMGNFFGVNDDWADRDSMTFHTAEEVAAMLEPFDVELMKEIEEDGSTAIGSEKHWHLFNVTARKR